MPKGSSDHHSVYARRRQRGSRLAPLLLLALSLLPLAGCATRLDLDPTTTGTIPPAPTEATAAVAPASTPAVAEKTDDWEAVRRRVVAVQPMPKPPTTTIVAAKHGQKATDPRAEQGLAWENADSGNSGTITELIASSSAGRSCRNFATTLASVDGVRAYRGELCRSGATWEYTKLEPVDRAAETRPKS